MKTNEKRKVGRPKIDKSVKKELRTVYISKEVYEFYFINGGENFSKGVEMIAKKLQALHNESKQN
jgi:uncharacterized protein (DUF4415 family)